MSISYYEYLSSIDPSAAEEIVKGLTKPKGVHENSDKPPSMPGLPAPGNTAGPGRPSSSTIGSAKTEKFEEAKTIARSPKGNASGKEVMYLPKKDFPQAPKGTIGSTDNSWKVPAGLGRALGAQSEESSPTTSAEAVGYNKTQKNKYVIANHLRDGTIASKNRLDGDNASDTFKVVIQGNGSGIMKPQVITLRLLHVERSAEKPENSHGWSFDQKTGDWVKEEVKEYDPYNRNAIGTFGSGNITPKKNVQREESFYKMSVLHGSDRVPVTVSRIENGIEYSVQSWQDGCKDISSIRADMQDPEDKNLGMFELLKKLTPPGKHKELKDKLMDAAVDDIIANNNDRHGFNFVINPGTGEFHLIDHGFCFCNSMHGNRNYFLHRVFHGNMPIRMSKEKMTRLSNLGLSDYKRSMEGLSDWEAGQTFLRNRYVVWLQKNHGHIDRQKFLHTMNSNSGLQGQPGEHWGEFGSVSQQFKEYGLREEHGMLPHQLFESWAKAYIEDIKNQPDHPDYHDVKELEAIGVFMEAGFPTHQGGADGYRKAGKHRKYEKSIRASFDIPQSVGHYMQTKRSQQWMQDRDSIDDSARKVSSDQETRLEGSDNQTAVGKRK